MGTNYYVKTIESPCPTCGHDTSGDRVHIGKSSVGWAFLHARNDELSLTTHAAWVEYLQGRTIIDEYGDEIYLSDLLLRIEKKKDLWTAFTAPKSATGGGNPHEYEYIDPEGYRMSKHREFS